MQFTSPHRPRTVVIAPRPPAGSRVSPALFRVGGLTALIRALHTLRRSGFEDLAVVAEGDREAAAEEIRADSRLQPVRVLSAWDPASWSGRDFLLVAADRVFSPEVLEAVTAEVPPPSGCAVLQDKDGRFAGMVYASGVKAPSLESALADDGDLDDRLENALAPAIRRAPPPGGFVIRVRTPEDARRAEGRLMKTLVKDSDGFLARLFDRSVSLAITRRLCRTAITPNQVTLIHSGIGLLSAWLFAQPDRWVQVAGSLLFLFSSIVDGCDGELARLKFQQSKLGGWLDIWSDNVVHIAVFGAIAVGLYRADPAERYVWLGLLACLGVLLSAGIVSWKVLRPKFGEGNLFVSVGEGVDEGSGETAGAAKQSWLTDVDDFLARRDFIFLLIPLAAFGKLEWFLWASAIGGNLFFLSLVFLYARAR